MTNVVTALPLTLPSLHTGGRYHTVHTPYRHALPNSTKRQEYLSFYTLWYGIHVKLSDWT